MGGFSSLRPAYMDYLQDSQLKNLRLYKYGAVDKSLITHYILKPYWDYAITLFPRWLAPNLITLIGLFFMIFNVVLTCVYIPDLNTEGASWIYISFAVGLWLYSTFDNVDGRQARRTQTSSPLGELFDHGCDAINCTYVALLQAAALGLGHSVPAAVLLYVTVTGFYMSTAEEYYTGVLYLGYVNGPTEGIIITCLAFLWSGFYGPESWHVALLDVPSLSWLGAVLPKGTTAANVFVYGMVFFFLLTQLPVSVYAIIKACEEKRMNVTKGLVDVFAPFLVCTLFICLWLKAPGSTLFVDEHFILFSIFVGYLFGEMASDIILAHLTKSAFPKFKSIYYSLGSMTLLSMLSYFDREFPEYSVLWILSILTMARYYIRATQVIQAFCDFLGIQCFRIPAHKYTETVLPVQTNPEIDTLLVNEQQQQSIQEQEYRTF